MGYLNQQVELSYSEAREVETMDSTIGLIRALPMVEGKISEFAAAHPNTQAILQYKSTRDRWLPLPTGWVVIKSDSKSRTAVRYSPLKTSELIKGTVLKLLPGIIIGGIIGFAIGSIAPAMIKKK